MTSSILGTEYMDMVLALRKIIVKFQNEIIFLIKIHGFWELFRCIYKPLQLKSTAVDLPFNQIKCNKPQHLLIM